MLKSVEECVQNIHPRIVSNRLGIGFLVARHGFEAPPDLTDVILLQLILHFHPICFSLP